MGFTESSRYCPNCKRKVLVRQETPNHTVHVLLTLFSCGLWGFVWLLITLMALGNPWRCTICGSSTASATASSSGNALHPTFDMSRSAGAFIGSIRHDLERGDYSKVILIGVCVVGLLAILIVPSLIESNSKKSRQPIYSPSDIAASQPATVPKPEPSPSRRKPSPTPTPTPETEGFNTDTSRQILASFFIKPVLREMLNNPDSLQDLRITSISPVRKMAGVYRATVFYRAENAFGALVAQEQTFMVTRGTGTGLDAWRVTPVRD